MLGVKKHMTIEEAKAIAPSVEAVSIYKEYGSKVSYKPYQECSEQVRYLNKCQIHTKASRRSRSDPSLQVEKVILRHGAPTIERGSIDEFYFDITELVSKRIDPHGTLTNISSGTMSTPIDLMPSAQSTKSQTSSQSENSGQWHGVVYGGGKTNLNWQDLDHSRTINANRRYSIAVPKVAYNCDERMRVASTIVHEIRSSIMKELQITCSAGIAKNKLLARIASNLNKPNQQTIILRRGVESKFNCLLWKCSF